MTEAVPEVAYAPLCKAVEVRCSPERAFDLFTRTIGAWWPLATHSVYGSGGSLSMGSGPGAEIVEAGPAGERAVWGRITAWDPGRRLAFTWHPGVDETEATHVDIRFRSSAGGTLVELEHRGWEKRRDPAGRRADYDAGWNPVLEHLREWAERPLG